MRLRPSGCCLSNILLISDDFFQGRDGVIWVFVCGQSRVFNRCSVTSNSVLQGSSTFLHVDTIFIQEFDWVLLEDINFLKHPYYLVCSVNVNGDAHSSVLQLTFWLQIQDFS